MKGGEVKRGKRKGKRKEERRGEGRMHKYGDCSFCDGEEKNERVELVYQYGKNGQHSGELYIFQNVPAGVCQQCGEKNLTARVAREIEQRILRKERWEKRKTISVPVDVFSEEEAV